MYLSLRDISGDDHSNKNEIHALERRVEKLARSNERCREKLSNVTQLYEVERVKVEKGEGRRNKAKVRYERVKLELREVKDDNQFIRNGMLTLEAQNERYTIDNEALLDQLCTLKKRVDKYEKDTANRQLIFQNTLEVSQHEHKRSRSIIGLSDTESTSTPRVSTEKPPEMETNISGTLTRFKNRVEELEQERITLRERDQVLTAKLSSVESQLGLKCEELASVDVVIEALNSEIRESRERCQGNECPSSQRLLEELASHQAVGTQGQNQLALNRAKRVELSNEMIRAKSQLAEMEGTLCEVRRENEQLRRDTESDKGPAAGASLLTETVALKGKLAEVKKSRMAIQDELGDHKLRVAELELELEDELEKRVPRSESEVVRGLQEELGGFKAKYVELGNEIIQAKNQERDATTAVKKLTTQSRILEREAKHAEKELAEKTEQCKNGQCSYAQNMVKDNELQVKIYKDLHSAISQKEEEYKELKEEITTLDQSLIRIVKVEEREWTIKMKDEKVQEMQTVQKKKEEYQEVLHDHVTEIIDKGCAGCMHLMDKCGKYKDSRELIKEEFIELKLAQADREGEETDTINEIKQALKLQHDSEISKVKLELEGLEMRRKELSDAFKETQKKYLSEVMKNSDLEEDLEEVNGRVGEMEEKITQLEKSSKTNSGQAKHLNKPRSVLNMKSIFEPKP